MDKKKKVNKLENLKITSVDLCTQGANPEAYIKFYKSQDEEVRKEMNEENKITKEEKMEVTKGFILEKMEEEDQKTLKALMDKYNVEGEENPDKEEKKEDKKEEEAIEEANKGMKKAMDEAIKKAMDKLDAVNKEIEIAKAARSFVKYEGLGMDPEEVAKKYVSLKEVDEEVAKSYIDVLDDKLDLQDKQGIFKSYGRNGQSRPGWDGIEAKADEIRKAQPTMTREQAIAKAIDANPELVAEYEAQR